MSGPLVYPAAHLFIYNALYLITDKGTDIFVAQCTFAVVYLGALSTAMACYRMAKVWHATQKLVMYSWVHADYGRHRPIYFPSSFSRKGYTAYSSCGCSTTASLSWQCSPLYTSTKEKFTPLEVLPIHLGSG